ncbi:MAG: hypothetical protein QNJ54_33765 [Prochloraceae cyanobacterium]|nr:hypothetical protein [Prochloraceae cyanobacterium]
MTFNKEAKLINTLRKILDKQSKVKIEGSKIIVGNNSIEIPQNIGNKPTNARQTDISI